MLQKSRLISSSFLIFLLLLTMLQGCSKNQFALSQDGELLKYNGKNTYLQKISDQLLNEKNSIDYAEITSMTTVDWEKFILYRGLTDTVSSMLIPILKNNQPVEKYLSLKIQQKDDLVSAEIKTPQIVITNGNTLEKSRLQGDLLMLRANGITTSVLPDEPLITTKSKLAMSKNGQKIMNTAQTMSTTSNGTCTTVLTAYYQYYPGTPGEQANFFFMNELTAQLSVLGIPFTYDYGNPNGIAIIGPIGSPPYFTSVIAQVINITEITFGEDFHLLSQSITSSCSNTEEPPPSIEDPCANKIKTISKVSKPVVKTFSSLIAAKLPTSSYEWGAPINLTTPTTSGQYMNTPIFTDSEVDQIAMPFSWNSTNGYTVGGIHSHPGGSAPDYTDIFAFLHNNANANLQQAGQSAIDFYRNNAFQIVVTQDQNYVMTVKDWGKLETLYSEYTMNPQNFVDSITSLSSLYQTDLHVLLAKFGDAINVFISGDNREDLIPVTLDKTIDKIKEIPCP